MTIYDKIWYEMLDSKMREFYCTAYLKRQKRIKQVYKIATLVFSASGILGWAFFKNPTFGVVTSSIVSVISLLQLIEGNLFHSDDQLDAIYQITRCHETQFRSAEQLFIQLSANEIEDSQANKSFYQFCDSYAKDIYEPSKKVSIAILEGLKSKAELQSQNYLQRYNRG